MFRVSSFGLAEMLIVLVLILLALPLLAVVFGVLWVTPVRQVTEPVATPQHVVVIPPNVTPTDTLRLMPTPGTAFENTPPPIPASSDGAHLGFLDPEDTLTWLIVLPSMAGLALLCGAVAVALVVTNWKRDGFQPKGVSTNGDSGGKWSKLRYVLLALLLWFALSTFLVLDLGFAVSLHLRFVAAYAAFWVLVGALLLYGRPLREKLIILTLLVFVLFAIRFVDWTSRKPFLKDLYRIKEGMAPAQVDQVMDGYMRGYGGGPAGSHDQYEFDERGEIVRGWVTFRHTNEGWGNSDWGVVTFENGRVAGTRFLPD